MNVVNVLNISKTGISPCFGSINLSPPPSLSSLTSSYIENVEAGKDSFLQAIREASEEYRKYGARSSKKVDRLHTLLMEWLKKSCEIENENKEKWTFELEKTLPSCNASGEKRCDIVASYCQRPRLVFPVKFIMSNYYQNKNNNWEVLTGECSHLKWSNHDLRIIPINIIFSHVPYLDKSSIIKKWEEITYEKSFKIIDQLKTNGTAYDTICYIIDVEHLSKVGEPYAKLPILLGFNKDTPYRCMNSFKHLWE